MKSIAWEVSVIFIECGGNSIFDAKSKTSLLGNHTVQSRHISLPPRHIHILHCFGHFGRYMEIFAFIFNNTYNTLIESEKIWLHNFSNFREN